MNRTQRDRVVAVVVGSVVLLGGFLTWQATQSTSGHMGPGAGTMHTSQPVWTLVGTLVVAGVIVAIYLGVRAQTETDQSTVSTHSEKSRAVDSETTPASDPEPTAPGPESEHLDKGPDGPSPTARSTQVLDLLPDDERRILQPVVDSPGLTQIELRDRASFSKSKISQTVTNLEKRGLLYREPQGRTYRVYPSDELSTADSGQEG